MKYFSFLICQGERKIKKIEILLGIISPGSLCWQESQKNKVNPKQSTQTIIPKRLGSSWLPWQSFPKSSSGRAWYHTHLCKHCYNNRQGKTQLIPARLGEYSQAEWLHLSFWESWEFWCWFHWSQDCNDVTSKLIRLEKLLKKYIWKY